MGRKFENIKVDSKSKRDSSSEIRIDHASLKEKSLPRNTEKSPQSNRSILSQKNQFESKSDFLKKISNSSSLERMKEIRSDE